MRQVDAASDDVEKHVPWICRQITQGVWPKLYRVMLDMDRFGGNAERQP
jgi:hypothetical protein